MAARAVISLLSIARLAAMAPMDGDVPPANYVKGGILCNITGFNDITGNYTQTTYQNHNVSFDQCLDACRAAPDCLSFSWAARYSGCWFFNQPVEKTALTYDPTSYFAHFDKICEYCETDTDTDTDSDTEDDEDFYDKAKPMQDTDTDTDPDSDTEGDDEFHHQDKPKQWKHWGCDHRH